MHAMEIEPHRGPTPLVPAAGINDFDRRAAGDRTRSADICYTAGLDDAGSADLLRRQAQEELRGPDLSYRRRKPLQPNA